MSLSDLLASAGVSLLLIAFYLNLKKLMPIVFLNAVWGTVALISLFKHVPRGTIIK